MPASVEELESRLREASESSPGSSEHVAALNAVAWEIALRDAERARRLATEAKAIAEALADRRQQALATRTLGYCHLMFSELAEGIELSRGAAKELGELGDPASEATALNTLGVLYSRLGDFDKALEYALECQRLNREAGDVRGEAWAYVEIGNVHYGVGDFHEAKESFEKALAAFRSIGYVPGAIRALTLLGNALENLGEAEDALRCFEESLGCSIEEGFALGVTGNSTAIGRLHHRSGGLEKAREHFERALDHAKTLTIREVRVDILLRLAELDLDTQRPEEARRRLEEAKRLVDDGGLRRLALRLWATSSKLHEQQGSFAAALADFQSFHRVHEQIFSEEGRARLRNVQIRSAMEQAEKEAEIQKLRFVELAGMQARLVQAEKMALLGRLVAGLSHELNNSVGVISANASLGDRALARALEALEGEGLAETMAADSDWRRALETLGTTFERMESSAKRVTALVQSLRSFARVDEAERARVDPSRSLADAARLLAVDLPSTIRVIDEIAPVGETDCYPARLNQAFMTLLDNAREAIDGKGSITLRSRREGAEALLEIEDTGRGMAPERVATLFEFDFTRKESQVRFRMGLAHARQVVEEHRGTIEVESEPGCGTTFRVRLPMG